MADNMPDGRDVTRLLQDWRSGDAGALEALMPLVYSQLRGLAAGYLSRESPGHTLQPTALVHEAFLKLFRQERVDWQNRSHFYGIAAQLMRRILVDHARSHHRHKRGSGGIAVSLDEPAAQAVAAPAAMNPVDVVALDRALQTLEQLDPRQGRLVELRFFGGLTIEETAEVLGLSTGTVKREWAFAKALLFRELQGAATDPPA
jgi:RNA polymerase sigma factor (TIGR02999 family)